MILYLILQTILTVVALAGLYLLWRKQVEAQSTPIAIPLTTEEAQAKIKEWSDEWSRYRHAIEERLKSLNAICDQARRILEDGKTGVAPTSAQSREASELKEALTVQATKIPTLEQIEVTKQRLKSDLPIDLRSLLKDQLA